MHDGDRGTHLRPASKLALNASRTAPKRSRHDPSIIARRYPAADARAAGAAGRRVRGRRQLADSPPGPPDAPGWGNHVLSHHRVLDLTDERGHFAGYLLAALGAEVIAIEPPEGIRARRLQPFVADDPGPAAVPHPLRLQPGQALGRARLGARPLTASGSSASSPAPGRGARLGRRRASSSGWAWATPPQAAANPGLVHAWISRSARTGRRRLGGDGPDRDGPSGSLVLNGDRDRPPVRLVLPQAFAMAAPSPPAPC